MKYIENWLNNLDELLPEKTGVEARLQKPEGVKALIFDIYGTLLISASGDIDQATFQGDNLKRALAEAGFAFVETEGVAQQAVIRRLLEKFMAIVASHQDEGRKRGTIYPEIDIRKVWEDLLAFAEKEKMLDRQPGFDVLKLTFIFELLSNRVWPMPGMMEVIKYFHQKGYPLGIVSNAQYYTPVMMNYFLTRTTNPRETIEYFDPELTVFSYKLRKSKPDAGIFDPMLGALKTKYGIDAGQAAFIGNDMLKDIYPANKRGMKTVFFAGDKRSLRLHEDRAEVKGLVPDAVITDLNQLKQIF
jgi:putative hydrolase of the HAD superfamily